MKKILVLAVIQLFVFSLASNAIAEWNQKSVSEVVEKVKAGKDVDIITKYPPSQTQIVQFFAGDFIYSIDIRTKLCFVSINSASRSASPVSCKAIKDGYPLMAPIIDWEK